ncbi:glycosyl transferase family protein [Sandarakinorhabdus sp.]|uniref:glycosyl transferase family protein n=1 Tax=Sandarakinorhabdus sp. TaxID=1916663 RepID=UPI00286D9CA3|nr:glycosyl transferase family protein [Sandarakinorhabdus sp.]
MAMTAILLAIWQVGLHEVLLVTAAAIALLGADDLAVDLIFVFRIVTSPGRRRTPTPDMMRRTRPLPIAIFVPAWDESPVIAQMLAQLTATQRYPDYRVFVGLYPNDPAGRLAVGQVADPRITPVINPATGPTTKADCLNALWQAMCAHETHHGLTYNAVVLHDAEDVVHPQELTVFDAMIPGNAMVQLPVLPLPDPTSLFVAGHYMDEFAESHAKELVVRQALGATVPSAGVGCAIDRAMLGRIAAAAGGRPFHADSLTEDYELGHRVRVLGGRTVLVRTRHDGGLVATAEYFPGELGAAVRQKARWLTGIALAGWDRIGWHGGAADRWMLLRDRKAPLAALLTLIAYFLLLAMILDGAMRLALPAAARMPAVTTGWVLTLLWVNWAMLCWRLMLRALFTTYAYGPVEGLLAVPRAMVGNIINAGAAWLALRRYWGMLRGGRLTWDKTRHRFPEPI